MKSAELKVPNSLHNIDRSTWVDMKFGDMVENIVAKIQPTPEDSSKYIGLEHLDSGSIHIHRWGTVVDLKGEKIQMKKGDVIFGKRNAYLRRASVAPFDGICSAHAMVLRAKDNVVDPNFLPFFMNSDYFMDRAITISVGSLSPTINWSTLAKEVFSLPPLSVQKKLVELLGAADQAEEFEIDSLEKISAYIEAHFYDEVLSNEKWPQRPFGELMTQLQYGTSQALRETGEVPILRMNNLNNGEVDYTDLKYLDQSDIGQDLLLDKNDILFNRTNSHDLVGKVALYKGEKPHSFASYLLRIKVNLELLDPKFVNYYLNSKVGVERIRVFRTPGVSQSNINANNLKKILVPVPPLDFQKELMKKLDKAESLKQEVEARVRQTHDLKMVLINSLI